MAALWLAPISRMPCRPENTNSLSHCAMRLTCNTANRVAGLSRQPIACICAPHTSRRTAPACPDTAPAFGDRANVTRSSRLRIFRGKGRRSFDNAPRIARNSGIGTYTNSFVSGRLAHSIPERRIDPHLDDIRACAFPRSSKKNGKPDSAPQARRRCPAPQPSSRLSITVVSIDKRESRGRWCWAPFEYSESATHLTPSWITWVERRLTITGVWATSRGGVIQGEDELRNRSRLERNERCSSRASA